MDIQMRRLAVAVALVCCALTSCGTQRAGEPASAGPPASPRPSASDAPCDVQTPENTDEDTGPYTGPDTDEDAGTYTGPDTDEDPGTYTGPDTDEDPGTYTGPDTDEDATGTGLPDTTSEDQGGRTPVDTEEDADLSDRWYSMTGDFRAYLDASASKEDRALAARLESVSVCTTRGGARTLARVRASFEVDDSDALDRTAAVFAHWRHSVYGDHGHVEVLAPAKMTAEKDW
ncbi:hypothetical protein [Streptomyces griseosporeus]|uniref:hypothetical protein n=1 Tax=Streptomyces griseosporeus TaxID=1910 RepID=UPI00167E7C29|nr:hypothetical protein [Streptomyces griseosporeus]GHF47797.1 hypothetical protein GCM10018783_16390 [Streptomyces griseosporeus]